MAYECIACVEPTASRFVFTDLEDGNVASVCLGHAPAFLISAFMESCRMTETDPVQYLQELMQADTSEPTEDDDKPPADDKPVASKTRSKQVAEKQQSEPELVATE